MSFFEWMCERHNPGSVGSVSTEANDDPRHMSPTLIVICFVIAMTLFLGFHVAMVVWVIVPFAWKPFVFASGAFLLYCGLGYSVRPEPDTSNMGWCGGLIDNPFRYTDDWNRTLLWLKILLLPGAFIGDSIVRFCRWILSD